MSETLWAPWRMDYILGEKPTGCVFCNIITQGKARWEENLVLAVRPEAFVIMNRYPYTHAHIMIVPTKHASSLEELSTSEQSCFFDLIVKSQTAMGEALSPQGMNLGMNIGKTAGAGIEDHLHMHIVPRWDGDTNFMPILAHTRVMPEHIDGTYQTLKPYFEKLGD